MISLVTKFKHLFNFKFIKPKHDECSKFQVHDDNVIELKNVRKGGYKVNKYDKL